MLEQVTSVVRVHKAPQNYLGILGQVFFVDFYNVITHKEETIGTIYPDGSFTPPHLKQLIKEKEVKFDAVTTPLNVAILSSATTPITV